MLLRHRRLSSADFLFSPSPLSPTHGVFNAHQNARILKLPDEVLLHIFSYFDPPDLCPLSSTCQRFYRLTVDPALWNTVHLGLFRSMIDDVSIRILVQSKFSSMLGFDRVSLIRNLSLSGCTNITDAALRELASAGTGVVFRGLCRLDLSGCSKITDAGLDELSRVKSFQLVQLQLDYCESISSEGILRLLQACPRLRLLSLKSCDGICDRLVGALAVSAPKLRELDLQMNSSLSERGFAQLLQLPLDQFNNDIEMDPIMEDILQSGSLTTEVHATQISTLRLKVLNLSWCKNISNTLAEVLIERVKVTNHALEQRIRFQRKDFLPFFVPQEIRLMGCPVDPHLMEELNNDLRLFVQWLDRLKQQQRHVARL